MVAAMPVPHEWLVLLVAHQPSRTAAACTRLMLPWLRCIDRPESQCNPTNVSRCRCYALILQPLINYSRRVEVRQGVGS